MRREEFQRGMKKKSCCCCKRLTRVQIFHRAVFLGIVGGFCVCLRDGGNCCKKACYKIQEEQERCGIVWLVRSERKRDSPKSVREDRNRKPCRASAVSWQASTWRLPLEAKRRKRQEWSRLSPRNWSAGRPRRVLLLLMSARDLEQPMVKDSHWVPMQGIYELEKENGHRQLRKKKSYSAEEETKESAQRQRGVFVRCWKLPECT